MSAPSVIRQLLQTYGGPCALDKIHVPYLRAGAGPAAKIGIGIEFYLPNSDRAGLRSGAINFLADYCLAFPNSVNEFLARNARRSTKFIGDPSPLIMQDASKFDADTGYSTSLFGAVDIGLPNDDIEPYQAHVLVQRKSKRSVSFVSASVPVCSGGNIIQSEKLVECALRWATMLQPTHGCAGFTFIFASGMQQNSSYILPMLKRFPGFDFQDGVSFCSEVGARALKIKSINWLTVLGTELVAELGGLQRMKNALDQECILHPYDGGVIIQASDSPVLGDKFINEPLPAYKKLARYTQSVRFEDYEEGLFSVPEGLDSVEETLTWIRRFD